MSERRNIYSVIKENECSGCSACALICPYDALFMDFNNDGFYEPHIKGTCTNCGLCLEVCTAHNNKSESIKAKSCFVSVAKDRSILSRSSSGGIAHVLSQSALDKNWCVCGVAYDSKNDAAKHIIVKTEKELHSLQGSKYLQSINYPAFNELLTLDKAIVFGTPCQIAGLHNVLKKINRRDNFLLVDIFCHGVPSQLLWKRHLEWLRKSRKINNAETNDILFRKAKYFIISINEYQAWYNEDAFYTFFLKGWLKNRKCHRCDFRRSSYADIRIGDCMAQKYNKLCFSPSCIFLLTSKGREFVSDCETALELYPESYDVIDNIQDNGIQPLCDKYDYYLERLKAGDSPDEIIHKQILLGKLKSLLKNRVYGKVSSLFATDLLRKYVK